MYTIVLLWSTKDAEVAHWDEAPLVRDWNGREVSLRAGPRDRKGPDGPLEPVAVYAPDEFTEAFLADPVRRYMLPVSSDRDPRWPSHPHSQRDSLHEADMWAVE